MKCVTYYLLMASAAWNLALNAAAEQATAAEFPAVRVHFGGLHQLAASNEATLAREIWELPETQQLKAQVLDKLAGEVAGLFKPGPETTQPSAVDLIRPLLEDVLQNETYFELRNREAPSRLGVWAIQLDEERIKVWKTHLTELFTRWQWQRGTNPKPFAFLVHGGWLVISDAGSSEFRISDSASELPPIRRLKSEGRPVSPASDYWLRAEGKLAGRFSQWLPLPQGRTPRVQLNVRMKDKRLLTEASFRYDQPHGLKLQPWTIPARSIRDPENSLISFTALQGLEERFKKFPIFKELGVDPPPNQAFAWGNSHMPFQVFAALPVPHATNALQRFAEHCLPRFNARLLATAFGELSFVTNQTRLNWVDGLPVFVPYLQPAHEPGQDFLVAGLLPMEDPSTNPPPAALLAQLTDRTNVLYYDWEITQFRIAQLRPVVQLLSLMTTFPQIAIDSPAAKWLNAVETKLGNCVTEVLVNGPHELSLTRNSPLGLSGLELIWAAHWLGHDQFPHFPSQFAIRQPDQIGGGAQKK